MKSKVVLVILNSAYGGAEKHVFDLVKHIDKEKTDLTVILPKGSKLAYLIKSLLSKDKVFSIKRNLLGILDLGNIFKEVQPDIIHLHSPRATFMGMISKKLFPDNSRIIVTAHGWIPERLKLRKIYEFLYTRAIKKCDLIIAVSHQVKEILINNDVKSDQIAVIHNGVEIPNDIVVQQPDFNKKRFIFLGRFIEEKGITYLLEATERLQILYPDQFHLHIYGEGPMQSIIEKWVNDNKGSTITLNGFVQPNEVMSLLTQHDIFLISSVQEGFPYTLLEAFSAGLTVITSNVGGIKEAVLDGENGFLVPPKDVNALTGAMEKFIKMPKEDLYNYKQKARERSLDFSVKQMISQLENQYQLLVEERSKN